MSVREPYLVRDVQVAHLERGQRVEPLGRSLRALHRHRRRLLDSELAERVMLHFAQRPLNAAVLPVHDSFIMHHGYETDLRTVMDAFFRERFGHSIRLKAVLDRIYSTADGPKNPPEKGKYEFVTDDVFELFEYFQVGHEQRWMNFRS